MTLLLKITGFVFIILTTSMIGFSKANELNLRYKKLNCLHKNIATLKEGIRLKNGDIDRLLKLSFSEYPVTDSHLKRDDIELLDEFFSSLGEHDTKAEYERCELYISLLKSKEDEAKSQYHELSKLYKNIGVLSGVLICIFFL